MDLTRQTMHAWQFLLIWSPHKRKKRNPAKWGWWLAGGCSAVAAWLWEGLCWCMVRRQGRRRVPGYGVVWLKGAVVVFREESWSLGSLYRGNWEERQICQKESEDGWLDYLGERKRGTLPSCLETRVSGGAGWTAVLSSLGRFRLSPVPLISLTRSSEGAELLGAPAKTFKITLLQETGASPPGPYVNHFVPPELTRKTQDLASS